MKILQLTAHFSPNVGGVETHYDDLLKALTKRGNNVFVLTYRPLTTKTKWKYYEKGKNYKILRLPWFPGLFFRLVKYPVLEFLYLFPGLFLSLPYALLAYRPDVVHAHGLVSGVIAVFWKKIFRVRTVVSTHSIYHFPKKGLYRSLTRWMFNSADFSLALSKQSEKEITSLGVDEDKVDHFTYWIDLNNFKPVKDAKNRLGLEEGFYVLFVGRLVSEKGVSELLKAASSWDKNIHLVIAGFGPLKKEVEKYAKKYGNITYVGRIHQKNLPLYYSAADIVIIPSTSEEGFGRVILESLACGTPVIGSDRGAIPEAMDNTVGELIDVTPKNIVKTAEKYYKKPKVMKKLSRNANSFAARRYSEKNVSKIIDIYKE